MFDIFADNPIPAVLEFDAQLQILELLDHKVFFLLLDLIFLLLLDLICFWTRYFSDKL